MEGNVFKSFEKLKTKFNLDNREFLDSYKYAIFFNTEVRKCISCTDFIKVFTDAYKGRPGKTLSKLYKGLQKVNGDSTLYVESKWEKELNTVLSESDWLTMCIAQQTSNSSKGWQVFRCKGLL